MARRRTFSIPPRADGGPFLVLQDGSNPDGKACKTVYYTDTPPADQSGVFPNAKILEVTPDSLRTFPIVTTTTSPKYLQNPTSIQSFVFEKDVLDRQVGGDIELPSDDLGVYELLYALPFGVGRDVRFGLKLPKDYRFISEAIKARHPAVTTIRFVVGDEMTASGSEYRLGVESFDKLRLALDRIADTHQERALLEKKVFVEPVIRKGHGVPAYSPMPPPLRRDDLAHLTHDGKVNAKLLTKRDRKAVVAIVNKSVGELVDQQPEEMLQLSAKIELVTLNQLIEKFEVKLKRNSAESIWQDFFNKNSFILTLAFSVPTVYVHENVYVGGTKHTREGGKFADFLYRTASTGNLAIIEIKRPGTDLLSSAAYRDGLYTAHPELVGAVTQVIDQRAKLAAEVAQISYNSQRSDLRANSILCAVIAGRTPAEADKQRSFDLYRHSLTNVTVLTYEELLERLRSLASAMAERSGANDSTINQTT